MKWDSLSHEAKELYFHATSDKDCYEKYLLPWYRNFELRIKAGKYNPEKARLALFKYAMKNVAESYIKNYCDKNTKWYEMFSVTDRRELAEYLEEVFSSEIELGNSYV